MITDEVIEQLNAVLDSVCVAVNPPVYGLSGRGVFHLVALLTQNLDDRVVAQEVTCRQKKRRLRMVSLLSPGGRVRGQELPVLMLS